MKNTTIEKITTAFKNDQFAVQNLRNDQNFLSRVSGDTAIQVFDDGRVQVTDDTGIVSTGVMAVHMPKSMTINGKERHKKAFYVEGSYYGMGYLIGLMAADDVHDMTYKYLNNIIPDFIHKAPNEKIKKAITDALRWTCMNYKKLIKPDIPQQYQDEIGGLHRGLITIKGEKQCEKLSDSLYALNFGIDILLANIYSGEIIDIINEITRWIGIKLEKKADQFKVPIMCNAFSIKGSAVEKGQHFFGRDFMFSTAGVFQDAACMIIYNPDDPKAVPVVSQTAPGFIGSVTAMNLNGVAAGTDMNPSKMCSPLSPGFNSLGLVRHSVQYGKTMNDLIDLVKNENRGVSWLYPAADGQSGRACFIEAGKSISDNNFPYFDYFDKKSPYLRALTKAGLDKTFIKNNQKTAPVNGMIVRESDSNYPVAYYKFNQTLVDTYNSTAEQKVPSINTDEKGYIDKTTYDKKSANYPGTDDKNCPAGYYFAPQRESNPDLLIVTNGNISPEMRLTAMNDWIAGLVGGTFNDIQWRYDELNYELLTAMNEAKNNTDKLINKTKAQQIIDFRAPGSDLYKVTFPNYVENDKWKSIQIHGSISLCELKSKVITSHYGYYGDPWVTITLPNYFNPSLSHEPA